MKKNNYFKIEIKINLVFLTDFYFKQKKKLGTTVKFCKEGLKKISPKKDC